MLKGTHTHTHPTLHLCTYIYLFAGTFPTIWVKGIYIYIMYMPHICNLVIFIIYIFIIYSCILIHIYELLMFLVVKRCSLAAFPFLLWQKHMEARCFQQDAFLHWCNACQFKLKGTFVLTCIIVEPWEQSGIFVCLKGFSRPSSVNCSFASVARFFSPLYLRSFLLRKFTSSHGSSGNNALCDACLCGLPLWPDLESSRGKKKKKNPKVGQSQPHTCQVLECTWRSMGRSTSPIAVTLWASGPQASWQRLLPITGASVHVVSHILSMSGPSTEAWNPPLACVSPLPWGPGVCPKLVHAQTSFPLLGAAWTYCSNCGSSSFPSRGLWYQGLFLASFSFLLHLHPDLCAKSKVFWCPDIFYY